MKIFIFSIITIILGIVQVTILDYFKIFNIKPDFLLMSVVIVSLLFEARSALILSIFAGILKDTFAASTFGINTVLFVLWSFLIIRLTKEIPIDSNFIRAVLIFIVGVLHNTIIGLLFIYLGNFIAVGILLRIIAIQSLYTAIVFPLVFKFASTSLTFQSESRPL